MLSLGAAPRACVLAAGLVATGCAVELAGTGPQNVAILDAGAVPGLTGTNVPPFPDAGSAFDASEPYDGAPGQAVIDATLPHDRGCNLDGRFALRVAFDVNWVGTEFLNVIPVIKEGEGELSFVVLMELHHGPTAIDARFRNCSVTVPEFVSSLGEHYQARFDNAVWDSASMPVFTGQMQLACDKPGCRFSGEPLVALIGAALSSPNAAWPTSPSGATWPDHDGDGEPGVATYMLGPSDGNYDYPPVDIFGRRVRDLMLGLRVVVGIDGTLQSCDEFQGMTPGSTIHTRAATCLTSTRPFRCGASELSFLNDNLPVWTVRQGQFQAQRLDPEAECKEARQAFARNLP